MSATVCGCDNWTFLLLVSGYLPTSYIPAAGGGWCGVAVAGDVTDWARGATPTAFGDSKAW
jgi:hypothetical protein